jgi:hypothetical protein
VPLARNEKGEVFGQLLDDTRTVGREIQRVERALGQAEDSLRFNPRAGGLHPMGTALRSGLETLEYAAVNMRGLARSLADRRRLPDTGGAYDVEARERLATALREIAECMRSFGLLVRADLDGDVRVHDEALRRHLDEGRRLRDEFAEALPPWISARSVEWRLHAEVLVHLDRLLDLFDMEYRAQARNRRRRMLRRKTAQRRIRAARHRRPRAG